MKIALLTNDNREFRKDYGSRIPSFGAAPEALIQGFGKCEDVEVHVLSCLRKPVISPEKLGENICFHSLVVPKLGWLSSGYIGCIKAIREKLRNIGPDIVHGQGTEKDCAVSALFSGYPNVVTIHGNMAELAKIFHARLGSHAWLTARLEDFVMPRTTGVFCNSLYTRSLVEPRARKVWDVPNAIRLPFFNERHSYPTPRFPIVMNIGVISSRKRQLEVLQIAKNLYLEGAGIHFQFIGQADSLDPYASRFLEAVAAAERAGYASYLGVIEGERLIELLDRASALFHFPSEEAFGLVVAESLARNLKFFGSRIGGIPDICQDMEGAELFAPDDIQGIADALRAWARGGAPRPASAAETVAGRYHPREIAMKHLEIYREVLTAC
jgi:glycosyltransferase involved in cell wall biosynthesis